VTLIALPILLLAAAEVGLHLSDDLRDIDEGIEDTVEWFEDLFT
jgi:hypothetical protein